MALNDLLNGKWVNPAQFRVQEVAMREAFDSLTHYLGAWQDFAPQLVWSSSGTQPALGNGTKEAQFRLFNGDMCQYEGAFAFGSTTTAGTGAYAINLPFPAHISTSGSAAATPWIGGAKFFNAATGLDLVGVMQIYSGTAVNFPMIGAVAANNPGNWSATAPAAPGNGSNMAWNITYRIAARFRQ
jgi:hypothetical protein